MIAAHFSGAHFSAALFSNEFVSVILCQKKGVHFKYRGHFMTLFASNSSHANGASSQMVFQVDVSHGHLQEKKINQMVFPAAKGWQLVMLCFGTVSSQNIFKPNAFPANVVCFQPTMRYTSTNKKNIFKKLSQKLHTAAIAVILS